MIGRLRGDLVEKGADAVLLDVGGVGYQVAVTPNTIASLPGAGQPAVLHTHLHVREDMLALYGFASADERDVFQILIGVSGVGPKLALAVLATISPDGLRNVVVTEDVAALTAVPGIGQRSAQKLLLELRPKLDLPDTPLQAGSALSEVREALEGLGYQTAEIRDVLRDLPADGALEESLRSALQELGKQR
ncbi:MAG: Holliday junction branch migration protein RuvA [Actinomycetota bacterium]|nr:Holliday junction branch migration protein RuvA [Actinomycetota bacterium]